MVNNRHCSVYDGNKYGMVFTLLSSDGRYVLKSLEQLLASSRQTFAFSRDGALPFSKYMYRINSYTKTPVNSE